MGGHRRAGGVTLADLSPGRYLALTTLIVVSVLGVGFFLDAAVISRLEYHAAQAHSFSHLRNELAHGSAPVDQFDRKGRVLSPGTPMALLEIPALHMRAVVDEGTTPEVLMAGPGHLRSTVFPGEAGTSVILGRVAAYGGPFHALGSLHKGDSITVTTGAGRSMFLVIDVRRAGDPLPAPLVAGRGRLTLVTATGLSFLPSGVLRVDADMTTNAQASVGPAFASVAKSEQPLGTDSSNLWAIVFLLQALIFASVGAVWSWRRWGRVQTWIVFFPLFMLLGCYASDQFMRLLPNLM